MDNKYEDEFDIDFERFGVKFKKNWKKVIAISLIFGIIAFAFSSITQEKTYVSKFSFSVQQKVLNETENSSKAEYENRFGYILLKMNSEESKNKILKTLGNKYNKEKLEENIAIIGAANSVIEVDIEEKSPKDASNNAKKLYNLFLTGDNAYFNNDEYIVVEDITKPALINSQNVPMNTAGAFVLGFILSLIVIFLDTIFDKKIRNRREGEKYLNLPVFAQIPLVNEKSREKSCYKEYNNAYKELYTKLQYDERINKCNIINVTSFKKGEGVTTITENLANIVANKKKKILLISIGKDNEKDSIDLKEKKNEKNDNLFNLTINSEFIEDGKLFDNNDFSEYLYRKKDEFDLILLDSISYTESVDIIPLSNYADGTLFVISSIETNRKDVKRSLFDLRKSGVKIAGCVLNKIK